MGVLARLDSFLARTFNPGSVAVDPSARTFGIDPAMWSPSEYGSYISTSNAVYTVIKKRETYLSSLPLVLARLKSDGEADPVTKGAAYELTRKVNPHWTWNRLIRMTEISLCLWGSAYWFLERGQGIGVPREIYWARPDRVKVVPHATEYVARFDYEPVSGMEPIRFSPAETVWFRYPNPLDEYSGLSPLAAARLAADTQSAAMKQNYSLFTNGISIGGLVTPATGAHMTNDDANQIKEQLRDRAKGAANAHRWLVLLKDAKFQPMTLSPRDAEFIGLHKLTLEDVCRAYGVPLDLVGGQRTYANYEEAVTAMWTETIIPEARFLADEITEQFLAMFSGSERVDTCSFDHSGVEVLQEDEEAKWRIAQGQLQSGVMTINEYRSKRKEDPVPWGEGVWWGSVALTPIKDAEMPEVETDPSADADADEDEPDTDTGDGDGDRSLRSSLSDASLRRVRQIAYDSDEHKRLYRRFVDRTEPHEGRIKRAAVKLFRQQEQSILTELGKTARNYHEIHNNRAAEPEDADALLNEIFNLARWRKRFRETMRGEFGKVIAAAGQTAIDEVTVGASFDVNDPRVTRFLFRQAQRFAVEVNATTWDLLKVSLAEGIDAGEGTDLLAERVRDVMGDRIRSSPEVIARSETVTAYNGGTLEGWRQSDVVESKSWISALDDRTRETHVEAHGQTVGLDEDFSVGGGSGPAPGQIGLPEEDIQCRCSMLAGLKPLESLGAGRSANELTLASQPRREGREGVEPSTVQHRRDHSRSE